MSMEHERALLVTLVVGCNVFTEAFFESSASLSEVGLLAALLAAWDLVDDAILRGVSWSGCLDHLADLRLCWSGDSQVVTQVCLQLFGQRKSEESQGLAECPAGAGEGPAP